MECEIISTLRKVERTFKIPGLLYNKAFLEGGYFLVSFINKFIDLKNVFLESVSIHDDRDTLAAYSRLICMSETHSTSTL